MTYYVSSGTLNPTHSLTHSFSCRNVRIVCCVRFVSIWTILWCCQKMWLKVQPCALRFFSVLMTIWILYYSTLVGEQSIAISLSVCLSVREHISGTAGPIFAKFCVQIPCGHGSVLLWRRSDTLCTSGFMDDITFAVGRMALAVLWYRGGVYCLSMSYCYWNACVCVYNCSVMDSCWQLVPMTAMHASGTLKVYRLVLLVSRYSQ